MIIASDETLRQAVEFAGTGIHSFLVRPFRQQRFRQAVAEATDRARLVRESIRNEVLSSLDGADWQLTSKAKTGQLFRRIVDISVANTRADYVALFTKDRGTEAMVTRAQAGTCQPEWQRLLHKIASQGEALLINDACHSPDDRRQATPDQPLYARMKHASIAALMCLPLRIQGHVLGAICHIKTGDGARFTAADRSLASILALWSSLAVENVRLLGQVQHQYLQTDRLLNEVVVAQENERRRVAMEIHDGVAQWMVGASYSIKACSSLVAESRLGDLERELTSTRRTIQRSIRELRRAIADLRPLPLEEMGLAAAVRQATEALHQDGARCTTLIEGTLPKLTPAEENTIYWIIQEVLTNVRKHAAATRVDVKMQFRDNTFSVEVRDNGRGFSLTEVMNSQPLLGHMGLLGMKERAELLGGSLTIDSDHRKGTCIRLAFPSSSGEAARATL